MLSVRVSVRHGSAGREAGRTAVSDDHALPRTTAAHDHARPPHTTTHDRRARPLTIAHDRPRLPYLFEEAVPTPPQGFWSFRGLNCLARLALARERTPSTVNRPKVQRPIIMPLHIFFSRVLTKLHSIYFT